MGRLRVSEREIILAAFAVLLMAAAPVLAPQDPDTTDAFLLPAPDELGSLFSYSLALAVPLTLVLIAIYLVRATTTDRVRRVIYYTVAIIALLIALWYFGPGPVGSVIIFATAVGGFAPILSEHPCKLTTWKVISGGRGWATLLIFILLLRLFSAEAPVLQKALLNVIAEASISSMGENQSILDINQLIPLIVTPEERQRLVETVAQETPNWNQLSPSEQQAIIQQYLQQYIAVKKAIRSALEAGIKLPSGPEAKQLIEKELEQVPAVQQILKYAPALWATLGVFLYSLVLFFSEIAAWLVAMILSLVGVRPATKWKLVPVENANSS